MPFSCLIGSLERLTVGGQQRWPLMPERHPIENLDLMQQT